MNNDRYPVTIDAMSLLDKDAIDDSLEEEAFSSFTLEMMIKTLHDPADKFMVVCIMYGFQKNEIGFMLDVHPSKITRMHQRIQQRLRRFHEAQPEQSDRSEHEAIVNFFKTIYPNDPAISRLK